MKSLLDKVQSWLCQEHTGALFSFATGIFSWEQFEIDPVSLDQQQSDINATWTGPDGGIDPTKCPYVVWPHYATKKINTKIADM